mgnify:FL=1
MQWSENLKNMLAGKQIGNCPYCGSMKTDFSLTTVSDGMGYCVLWCNTCKHACYLSRIKTEGLLGEEKEIPKGLKY